MQADGTTGGSGGGRPAPGSHEIPAFLQQSADQALTRAAADARGMDAMGLPVRTGTDTVYAPGMGVYYVGPQGPPSGPQVPVGIPAGSDWDADVESYQQFSNPFLSGESSQTHPDDTALHYLMQGANIVSATFDLYLGVLNAAGALRAVNTAERSAEALRGAKVGKVVAEHSGQAVAATEQAAAGAARAGEAIAPQSLHGVGPSKGIIELRDCPISRTNRVRQS